MVSLFVILVAVYSAALVVRDMYELLKERRKIGPESRAAFIVVLCAMCALWMCWFLLCKNDPYRIELPDPIRWTGLVVTITGTILAVGALAQLRGVEGIDHLVTHGLFRRIRHPMYLGFILWIAGWSVFHGASVGIIAGLPGIASILWWRHLEDRRLTVQFGSAYGEYRKQTWF